MEEQGHICTSGKVDSHPWKNEIPCLGFLGMSLQGDERAVFSVVLGENAGAREQRGAGCLCVFRGHGGPITDKATW